MDKYKTHIINELSVNDFLDKVDFMFNNLEVFDIHYARTQNGLYNALIITKESHGRKTTGAKLPSKPNSRNSGNRRVKKKDGSKP